MSSTLVLLRHGQSTWNLENLFSGWTDVDLTPQGEEEARSAGLLLADEGLRPDRLHTSVLIRAIRTADLALDEAGWPDVATTRSWRLNERHYGALQGKNKVEMADRHGADKVLAWRRSYDVRPPALELADPRHPSHDELYADLDPSDLPATESLADVVERIMPYWSAAIVPDLGDGRTVLVVAHGNSIRALVMHLDHMSPDEVVGLNIPTGIPLVYRLNDRLEPVSSRYLGDQDAARAAADAVGKQAG